MGLIVISPDAEKHSRTYSLNSFAINKHLGLILHFARFVEPVASDFGKQFAVDVRLFIAFGVGHSLFVDRAQQHFRKNGNISFFP